MPEKKLNPTTGWRQSRFLPAMFNFAGLWLGYTLIRVVLFLAFKPVGVPARDVLRAFAVGCHLDLFAALGWSIPLVLWLAILPDRWFQSRRHQIFFKGAFLVFWMVQIFFLFAEYYFFEEFKSRFNTVAVDYLLYPHEVFVNIWDTYPMPAILSVCAGLGALLLWAIHKLTQSIWTSRSVGEMRAVWLVSTVVLFALLWPTVSVRETRFSTERVINELANNGAVAFGTAFWTRNLDYSAFYKTLPAEEAMIRARRLLSEPAATFTSPSGSIERHIAGDDTKPKNNVVLLLEESLGSEFWGCLGRTNTLTPELDHLAETEGMLFTNLFASGNRTVRGMEGVLSSFPPEPGDSIVKRDHSQNVESIARILKRDGYQTMFLYGGRGIFDGMRSFAVDNGYDTFVEQKHFAKPTFTTIWGVCDEDLYGRTIEECRTLAATGKPFLATVLTVSNHKPYTYPKGRIAENPDDRSRENVVKYTDYCLGKFFRDVKKEAFYDHTIFVVVADHGARVYGSQSIPIHSYEIPCLILGPAAVPGPSRVPWLGCSLDVPVTILGLLGRPYDTMFFGRDLLHSPPAGGRVLINHNRDIGMFRDNRLVVLGINKGVEFYTGNPKTEGLRRNYKPDEADLELERDAVALFQTADDLYVHERYRVGMNGGGGK